MRIIWADTPCVSEYDGYADYLEYLGNAPLPEYRMLDCGEYEECLRTAGKENWPSWTCYSCPKACKEMLDEPPINGIIVPDDSDEEWLPIPNFPEYYVSTEGKICSTRGSSCAWRRVWPTGHRVSGEETFILINEEIERVMALSELILSTFCRESKGSEEAVHLNGDMQDCHLSNLCWRKG
jgi:hypothetical protein